MEDDAGKEELDHEQDAIFQEYSRPAQLPTSDTGYADNVTGERLPADLGPRAREEEIDFMKSWEVWEEVPVEVCRKATGK